jgi:glycosyltransferase involved in cell wall biosynthesis
MTGAGPLPDQRPPTSLPLSVLIRTLNEADRIGKTLASVAPLNAEIVVIDAGSKDDTVKIAESYGAKVVYNPWPGYGPQRRFGEDQCGNDFVFSLDADEVLTPEIVAEIRELFSKPNPPPLINVRKALILPHWDKPPLWGYCHEYVLIYDRRVARTVPNPNWDKVESTVKTTPHTIASPLWHYSFRDWHHMIGKGNHVAKLAAETMPVRSRWLLALRLPFEFPVSFLKFYFVRRYCLAGIDGLTLATVSAFGRFARVAMLLERAQNEARKPR